MTRLTVVIPALNDAVMLEGCLRALAQQTRVADEIIVVDNGSEDATAEVARAAGARVIPEPKRGIFPATSTGFDAVTSELTARLDADSIPPADWLERIVTAFEADPSLDLLSGPGEFYGSNRVIHWTAEHIYIGGYVWFVSWILGHDILFGSNLAFRTAAWRRLRETVHRDLREIHDDLDLAINLDPDMVVRWDRTLRVGVSARPFATLNGLYRRVKWAFTTLALNSREKPLLERRAERRRLEKDQAAFS